MKVKIQPRKQSDKGGYIMMPMRINVNDPVDKSWKPIEDENDRRSRLLQFSEAVVKEVNQTFANDNVDIRAIGEEVYEKYGVRFEVR